MQKTILVVDDEQDIVDLISYNLSKEGFEVATANNGTDAVEIAQRLRPDLVILDIMMPDEDGYTLCRHIRNLPTQQKAKVAFLSAKSKESDIRKGLETGADAYFTKPFSTRTLLVKMLELLDQPST